MSDDTTFRTRAFSLRSGLASSLSSTSIDRMHSIIDRVKAHPLITVTYQDNGCYWPQEAPDERFMKAEPAAVDRK